MLSLLLCSPSAIWIIRSVDSNRWQIVMDRWTDDKSSFYLSGGWKNRAHIFYKCCFPARPPMDSPRGWAIRKRPAQHRERINDRKKENNSELMLMFVSLSVGEDSAKVTYCACVTLLELVMIRKYRPPIVHWHCVWCSNCCILDEGQVIKFVDFIIIWNWVKSKQMGRCWGLGRLRKMWNASHFF